jgi:hypothetical protein
VQTWQVILLAPGVELSLRLDEPLDADAAAQLQRAARPLLRALSELGVVSNETTETEDTYNGNSD